ncbi:MAG: hypothetical protein JOZ75_14860, partial [Candidatus Dormibacteraeota bacterium]|nr:hypothetical protein [Candidatus Dormibacteraeota bacterium]
MVDVISSARARVPRLVIAWVAAAIAAGIGASVLWSAPGLRAPAAHTLRPARTHVQAAAAAAPAQAVAAPGIRWSTGAMT